jgi:hypothetical protein
VVNVKWKIGSNLCGNQQSYANANSSAQCGSTHVAGQKASLGAAPDQQINPSMEAAKDQRLGSGLLTIAAEV